MANLGNIMLVIGFIGLSIISLLNFYTYKVMNKAASAPFTTDWWSQWFVLYLVMGSFLLTGLLFLLLKLKS